MILSFEQGRLGNQLFQYVGIRKYFSDHTLVLFGYDDLVDVIESIDAVVLKRDQLARWLSFGALRRVFALMAKIRLVGTVQEHYGSSTYSILSRRGLIPGVYLLKDSFFQHRETIDELPQNVQVKPDLLGKAKKWLSEHSIDGKKRSLVSVHIRRGDYLRWPSADFPAVLDLEWYRRAMDRIGEQVQYPLFLLFSDDPYYVRDIFREDPQAVISDNDVGVDLALMSLCEHGVLSASSLAWWGAWLSRSNHGNDERGVYIAPNNWAGHRRKQWYPLGFKVDWITYM